MYLEVEWDVKL